MFSIQHFLSIFLACVAVSRAEESTSVKGAKLSARMFGGLDGLGMGMSNGMGIGGFGPLSYYNAWDMMAYPWLAPMINPIGGCFGFGMLPGGLYNNIMFTRAVEPTVSRRALSLDAEQLLRRAPDQAVTCVNEKGVSNVFLTSHCMKAANKLAEKKASQANCGRCALSLVSAKGHVQPKQVSAAVLQEAARGILKACSNPKKAHHQRTSSKDVKPAANTEHQVAMVLSKGTGAAC